MGKRKVVLAVASGGGHWVQISRLAPAFTECDVHFVTTLAGVSPPIPGAPVSIISDASRSNKLGLLVLVVQVAVLILKIRPDVIVTTGAAPGLVALRIGSYLRARTVWIDSIANVEELSLSGKLAGRFADLWLCQWPAVACKHGRLRYEGAVV